MSLDGELGMGRWAVDHVCFSCGLETWALLELPDGEDLGRRSSSGLIGDHFAA